MTISEDEAGGAGDGVESDMVSGVCKAGASACYDDSQGGTDARRPRAGIARWRSGEITVDGSRSLSRRPHVPLPPGVSQFECIHIISLSRGEYDQWS